jgi:hypothetical protein
VPFSRSTAEKLPIIKDGRYPLSPYLTKETMTLRGWKFILHNKNYYASVLRFSVLLIIKGAYVINIVKLLLQGKCWTIVFKFLGGG